MGGKSSILLCRPGNRIPQDWQKKHPGRCTSSRSAIMNHICGPEHFVVLGSHWIYIAGKP